MPLPEFFGTSGMADLIEPNTRKQQYMVGVTLIAGGVGLAATLRAHPGSIEFNLLGLVVATIWCAGAIVVGPPRLWNSPPLIGRTIAVALAVGAGAFLFFLAADLIGQHLPLIAPALHSILAKADAGSKVTILGVALFNGVGEEVFFRGVLYDALPRRRIVLSTAIYVVVTAATGNVALVLAALLMGIIFSYERRSTGGFLAPVLTHLTWSTLMILCLPR
jgi:membrane protease YdiL (CAAX protease family)